jgi:hypothetical protein
MFQLQSSNGAIPYARRKNKHQFEERVDSGKPTVAPLYKVELVVKGHLVCPPILHHHFAHPPAFA